jgi:signal transduction histidine kinase
VTAEQELDRIAEITKQTLGFYRDSSTPVELDLTDIANGVFVLYERKLKFKKIDVKKRFASGAIVDGFPGEIRQVLANLVANAIDAVSPGGYLGLKIAPSHEWSGDRSPGVRVTLLDNGSGIAADRLKKIFEPFYTTKKDTGTGLGLWLTQNLIQKHHGTLRVRSCVNPLRHGTAFSIFFPSENLNEHTLSKSGGDRAEEDRPHAAGV